MDPVAFDTLLRQRPLSLSQLQRLASELESRSDWAGLQEAFISLRRDCSETGKIIGFVDYTLANASFHLGDLEGAIALAQMALRVEPSFPFAHHLLGRCYGQLGELRLALFAFQRCCSLVPSFGWGWYELASLQIRLHNWHQARSAFAKAQLCAERGSSVDHAHLQSLLVDLWRDLDQSELLHCSQRLWPERLQAACQLKNLSSLEVSELRLVQLTSQLDAFEAGEQVIFDRPG